MSNEFRWIVPQKDGVTVTVSRTQFAHQADRLGLLAPLSQAATQSDFAVNLRAILSKKVDFISTKAVAAGQVESPEAKQKRDFIHFLFGNRAKKEKGLVSGSETQSFARRLNGVNIVEESRVETLVLTRSELEKAIGEARESNAEHLKSALQSFDTQATTTFLDSNGNRHAQPEKTYKQMDAVPFRGGYIPVGKIIGLIQIQGQKDESLPPREKLSEEVNELAKRMKLAFSKEDIDHIIDSVVEIASKPSDAELALSEISRELGIPFLEQKDPVKLKGELAPRTTKRLFNKSLEYIQKPEEAYTEERVITIQQRRKRITEKTSPTVTPTDARHIFDTVFSITNRSAGSKIAGVPGVILDRNTTGIVAKQFDIPPKKLVVPYDHGSESGTNTFALFNREVTIGEPYASRMEAASILVTKAVDAVARRLDDYIQQQGKNGRDTVSVEEVSEYALLNLESWLTDEAMEYTGPKSRSHLQMDFFFLPTTDLRKKIAKDAGDNGGFLSAEVKEEIDRETQKGELRLAIFDISGGAGGTGVSEFIAQSLGRPEGFGLTETYIQSLIDTYEAKMGKAPESVIISPRREDLTLISLEYIPLLENLKAKGIEAHIVLADQIDQKLDAWDGQSDLMLETLEGKQIKPSLVAKRFTFLGAGKKREGDRGYIRTKYPEGMLVVPTPVSRVAASDKRINTRITEILERQLNELGVEVIPTQNIQIVDRERMVLLEKLITDAKGEEKPGLEKLKSAYIEERVKEAVALINRFAKSCSDKWPEVSFLGCVLKIDDKRPGRQDGAGELVSAYPIHAGVLASPTGTHSATEIAIDGLKEGANRTHTEQAIEYERIMLTQKVQRLVEKGALGIVVQPNLLTFFGRGDDFMETKMLVYANKSE